MGDFPLSWQPSSRFHLVEPEELQLRLDPEVEQQLASLTGIRLGEDTRRAWLRPNWGDTSVQTLNQFLRRPPATRQRCVIPRGAGPQRPRPGTAGDILKAVWGVPCVQMAATRVFDQVSERFERGWSTSSTGERVVVITAGALLAGSVLTTIYVSEDARDAVLGPLAGRDIPVPGTGGLKFHLRPRGGGLTVPLGVRGLSARGSLNADPQRLRNSDYDVRVTFDVMEYLRSRE
jgi:hypothetical protein